MKALLIPQDVVLSFKNDLFKKTTSSDKAKMITPLNSFNPNKVISSKEVPFPQKSISPNKVLISSNNGTSTNNIPNIQTQKFTSQGGQKGTNQIKHRAFHDTKGQ